MLWLKHMLNYPIFFFLTTHNRNPSGNILGLPGNASFAVFVFENNNFTFQSDSKIMHEKVFLNY